MVYAEEFRRLLRDAHERSGKGVLAFEHSLGLKGGALKAILDPDQSQTPRLDKAERIAEALGLEFYIGPPRDRPPVALPSRGWASCGADGWGPIERATPRHLIAPVELTDHDAFWAVAAGTSMIQEGIRPGDHVLVSPGLKPVPGDRVWVVDHRGRAALKRLTSMSDDDVELRGWHSADGGATQEAFTARYPRRFVSELAPIIAVYDGPPGRRTAPAFISDPRSDEFPPAPGRNVEYAFVDVGDEKLPPRIADALGVPVDADLGTAVAAVENLKEEALRRHVAERIEAAIAELERLRSEIVPPART